MVIIANCRSHTCCALWKRDCLYHTVHATRATLSPLSLSEPQHSGTTCWPHLYNNKSQVLYFPCLSVIRFPQNNNKKILKNLKGNNERILQVVVGCEDFQMDKKAHKHDFRKPGCSDMRTDGARTTIALQKLKRK